MKIQTKTGLLFTILTASTILIVSGVVYYFASRFTYGDFLKRLELRVVIAHRLEFEKSVAAYQKLRDESLEFLPEEKEYIIKTDTLSRIFRRATPQSFLQQVIAQDGNTVYHHYAGTDYAAQLYHEENGDYIVLVSAINKYGTETLMHLRTTLTITFILSVLVVYTTGIFFSRKTFKPVRELIRKSKDISAFNMGLRIEETGGSDEVSELAHTYNNMLDRIQTAFETQNNFISNASHELRTPLTTIIGEADWALQRERNPQQYQQSLTAILKQAEHLQNLTTRLLKLAQTTFDGKKQEWELIHADELVNEAISTVASMSRESNFHLNMDNLPENEDDTLINGNKTLLLLALVNIISNASKYSNHKPVEVEMIFYDQNIKIIIKDQGVGIPTDEVKRVFEPFFRASNAGGFEGYGIGLPLSMSILRQHHGHIEVYSAENKGTTVICTLPVHRGE